MAKEASPVRVIGCKHGLGEENPQYPKSPCRMTCQWRISVASSFYCSWLLFYHLKREEKTLTLRDTGEILSLSHESIRNIEASALKKLSEALHYIGMGVDPEALLDLPHNIRVTSSSTERAWRAEHGYPKEDL